MPRGNNTNAIPTVQEILLEYRYPEMSGHQPTCHVCCAMLMKLDMIFTSYSKLLVCEGSYLKLSGHGLCLEVNCFELQIWSACIWVGVLNFSLQRY